LTSTASTPLKVQSRDVTILGGHWIGQVADTRIQFSGDGITNCIVDGIDTTNVGVELGWGVSHATIRNCGFHDKPITEPGYFLIINGYQGYMTVQNCHFHNGRGGIFVNSGAPHNQFIDCEFDNLQSHGIYMDGSGGVGGYNIVTGCKFHDQVYQAGLHIKCNYNKIYNNAFYNYPAGGDAGLSIYSEYSPSYANDNEIYNNTFTDMTYAFWIGHNPANYPTLRNKIHDNTFTRVTNCIMLNPWNGAINTVEDTWIYYNTFTSCTDIFPASGDSPSLVIDTVIAYNDFSPAITNLWVESCGNTMVYGNIGMADFNVPSPLPIPPP
jgi:hypothetical protein